MEKLSQRELEILQLVAVGKTNQEIAHKLIISTGTVKAHTASIFRKLEAANRTEELIRQSVGEAGEGEQTSKQVSQMLGEISSAVTKVTDIMGEIAATSKEQAQGIEQVNQAVGLMDKVTQQNAASSEESSASAAELSSQAKGLHDVVATFHLERRAGAEAPAGVPSRPAEPAGPASRPGRIPLRPDEVFPLDDREQVAFQDF